MGVGVLISLLLCRLQRLQLGYQLRLAGAADARHLLAVLEEHECRHCFDAVLIDQLGAGVHVALDKLNAGVSSGQLLVIRRDGLAGAAPAATKQ